MRSIMTKDLTLVLRLALNEKTGVTVGDRVKSLLLVNCEVSCKLGN
jgi:hypothetical protein